MQDAAKGKTAETVSLLQFSMAILRQQQRNVADFYLFLAPSLQVNKLILQLKNMHTGKCLQISNNLFVHQVVCKLLVELKPCAEDHLL